MNQNPGHPNQNNPYWPYQSIPGDAAISESLATQPPQASTDPRMPGQGAGAPNMNAYGSSTEPAAIFGSPIAPGGNPISYDPLLAPPPPPTSSPVPNPYGSYAYPPLPAEDRTKRPGRRRTVLVVVITLIVLLGGSLFGGIQYRSYQSVQADNHATATALSIAQAANSQATGTAQANAKATSVASTYPFFANLVLADPLVDNTHAQYGWTISSAGYCAFSDRAYQVAINQHNVNSLCAGLLTNFSNFTFQADMTMRKGDKESSGGFFFRGDARNIDGYAFTIDQQRVYTLWITANGSHNGYRVLRSGTLSTSQFTPGLDQTTTLAVVARGEQISLYVNQQLIITLQDSTYTKGEIGFVAFEASAATTVAFDNAKVWA